MNTTKARIDRLTAEAVAFIRRAESARRKKRTAVEMYNKKGVSYYINGEELVELDENTFFSAERKETVHCVGNKDKVIINPILDWWLSKENKEDYLKEKIITNNH